MELIRYRTEIDGLRAIAVLAVVLYHAGLGCPGGYIGVDVFFVISGFLITSLIVRDLRAGKFSLVEFWERRARRILPAISVCVAVTLVAGWFLLLPADLENLGRSALAQCAFVANIYFWRTTNYFGGDNLEKPLLHTWSLAVEEQFYFVLPLVLIAMFAIPALRRPRALIGMLVTIFVISLGISVWGVKHQPYATFFLLPTRAWELLCGSLVAILPSFRSRGRWLPEAVSWVGLSCIILPIAFYSENTPFPGLTALPPCLGTAALIWANHPEGAKRASVVASLLSLSPMRFVGLISYSLYLWHWPVIVYANYWKVEDLSLSIEIGLVLISIFLAILSWRFIETPFRKRQLCGDSKKVFTFAGFSSLALVILAGFLVITRGLPDRLSAPATALVDFLEEDQVQRSAITGTKNIEDPALVDRDAIPWIGDKDHNKMPAFVLIGDSHAQCLAPLFHGLASDAGIGGVVISYQGTPMLDEWPYRFDSSSGEPQELFDAAFNYVIRNKIKHVFISAYWQTYQKQADADLLEEHMRKTIKRFAGAGVVVHVMMDAPVYENNVARMILRKEYFGFSQSSLPSQSREKHRLNNAAIYSASQNMGTAVFLDCSERLWNQENGSYLLEVDGAPLYFDKDHLTCFGAEFAWSAIVEPIFREISRDF